jgi:hypothetical protein
MKLERIYIPPTDKTPEVTLDPEGLIKTKGRGLILNKTKISHEITDWLEEYTNNPAEITYVIIAFEYLNSFSTTMIVSFIKSVARIISKDKKLIVRWYYEEDDIDILERGEYVLSAVNIPIDFIMTDNISGI